MRRRSLLSVNLFAAALLIGCSASVQREGGTTAPLDARAAATTKIVLVASPASDAVAKRPDWPALVAELTAAMARAAAAARLEFSAYQAGSKPAAEPGTLVSLKVADYKLIGTDKRFSMGAVAGSGSLDAEAVFADLQTGRELGRRKYSASAGALQGLFSAPAEKQLDAMAAQIVKDVQKP